jgi:hypothetical protein
MRCINSLRRTQNSVLPDIIPAGFNPSAADYIHFASKNLFKFFFHVDEIEQGMLCILAESHEYINVAVWTEIIAEY